MLHEVEDEEEDCLGRLGKMEGIEEEKIRVIGAAGGMGEDG